MSKVEWVAYSVTTYGGANDEGRSRLNNDPNGLFISPGESQFAPVNGEIEIIANVEALPPHALRAALENFCCKLRPDGAVRPSLLESRYSKAAALRELESMSNWTANQEFPDVVKLAIETFLAARRHHHGDQPNGMNPESNGKRGPQLHKS